MTDIGRVLTAMVTPFNSRGGVDYVLAGKLANALLDSGSDGVVIAGTTGESPTLSLEEKLQLFSEVRVAVGGRGVVIAGTGTYNTAESVQLTHEAESTGVDGALLVVPYYNKPDQKGLLEHFSAIALSTELPCILYNVPSRTAVNMEAETTLRLAQISNIVGIKEASGDMDQVSEVIAGAPEGFRVWSGNDGDTLSIIHRGGYGVVGVVTHLVGNQVKEMIEAELQGDEKTATTINERLLPLVDACFLKSNPVPVKYALGQLGWAVGRPRLPLVEPDEETARKIIDELARHEIDICQL